MLPLISRSMGSGRWKGSASHVCCPTHSRCVSLVLFDLPPRAWLEEQDLQDAGTGDREGRAEVCLLACLPLGPSHPYAALPPCRTVGEGRPDALPMRGQADDLAARAVPTEVERLPNLSCAGFQTIQRC